MQEAIQQFGYLAVFIGTFLEGETILALAGMAAAHGYLSLVAVIGVATVGAFLGDQACFYVGRRYGHRILARFPKLAAKAPRVQALLRRWDAPAVIVLRFLYGLRIAGPIVIGTCGISPWRLALFNFIGVLIWAPLVGGVGYLAGYAYALHEWLARFQHVQLALLAIALIAAAIAWYFVRRRRRA
jgi:membrane protein DedA with SNARE-associated domain